MNEKPDALRFGVRRDRETEILRVANTGEFLWHKDADARIANPGLDANPAMMHLFRALRRAEVVQAENERLREALRVCLAHWFKDDNPDELQENVAKFKELCGWENKR